MKSLHYKLFLRYAALIFSLLLIFMVFIYVILGNALQSNATSELQADCDNISTLIDTQIKQVDELSKRIVSSNQIQDLFLQDLYSTGIDSYRKRLEFSTALFDIIKLSFDNMSLNIFDTYGRYISVGTTNKFIKLNPGTFSELPWFDSTLDAYGKKVILLSTIAGTPNKPVFSLCRAFSPGSSTEETAVLELQMQYSSIRTKIEDSIHNQKENKNIYIYNQNGSLMYPYEELPSETLATYMLDIVHSINLEDSDNTRTIEKNTALFAYRNSSYTNWTVFVTIPKKMLFSSFYQFRVVLVIAAFLLLVVLLFITSQIATGLSKPLKRLEQTARSLTFDNLDYFELPTYKSNFKELDSLYHSFEQMQINLRASLNDAVSAHTMATDAKMLALQSQMNPHFLYNTLATIGILAEEGENDSIVEMCNDLSSLLRYISSSSSVHVELKQELAHTVSYIHLIQVKYKERIQFHINIDESLLTLKVPKLILQPLVENCIKYALEITPPWIILIDGFIENNYWILKVRDNGTGFTKEYLDLFNHQILMLSLNNPLPELAINGMGLLNLYMRLFLKYSGDIIFKLENIPEGGASITIGGPLYKDF